MNCRKHKTYIHRIDKNTSGLLLIARNLESTKFLEECLGKENKKKYLLLVKGLIKDKTGEIKMPIITNKKENHQLQVYFDNLF